MPASETFDPRRPFTRAQGVAHGITDRRLRGPEFQSPFHGIHLAADVELTALVMAEAALLLFPEGAFACHATAARIYGLPIPTMPLEHVGVVHAADRRTRSGIRSHVAPEALVVRRDGGLLLSAPEQVFLELAADLPLVEAVLVGDHLVARGLVTLKRLVTFCEGAKGRGSPQARAAAAYVRERVDSPMETRLRMLIVLAGLPEPEVNLTISDEIGVESRRYDLCWPRARVIVEYDGRHHIERVEQWESDLARRERIDDDRWRILVVTSKGIYSTPGDTLARVHRLLLERRVPGTPRRLATAWRRHFPERG